MNRIQEVVHKFRSGNTEKRESQGGGADAGGGGRRGMEPQMTGHMTTSGHMTSKMADHPVHTISSLGAEEGRGHTRWYVEPPLSGHYTGPMLSSSSSSSSQQAELSALPLLTNSGLQQTMLAALGRTDPVLPGPNDAASSFSSSFSQQPSSPEKRAAKARPTGTLEYKVAGNDTLEKIAARFDVTPSELKKLNRMLSRTVFENQVLYIPDPEFVPPDPPTPEPESPVQSPLHQAPKLDLPIVKMADKPPAHVPGHVMKIPSPPPTSAPPPPIPTATSVTLPRALSEDEAKKLDEECYERFIKVATSHICEGFKKVAGTLLVTPNAIMFDPDVLKEGERMDMMEAGGVVVYMDTIVSATLYHDLANKTASAAGPPKDKGSSQADKPDTDSHHPSPSPQLPPHAPPTPSSHSSSDLSASRSPGESTAAATRLTDGGGADVPQVSERNASSSLHGDSSPTTAGKAGTVGDRSPQDGVEGKGGLNSGSSTSEDHHGTPAGPTPWRGDLLLPLGEEASGTDDPDQDRSRLPEEEEADIQALLAGGRRDSLSALAAAGEAESVGSLFYPTSPEEVAKVGEGESSDTLVLQCADKLVSEILESVSWSSGLNTATAATTTAAAPELGVETATTATADDDDHKVKVEQGQVEVKADLSDGGGSVAEEKKRAEGKPLAGEAGGSPAPASGGDAAELGMRHARLSQDAAAVDNNTNSSASVAPPPPPPQTASSARRKPSPSPRPPHI